VTDADLGLKKCRVGLIWFGIAEGEKSALCAGQKQTNFSKSCGYSMDLYFAGAGWDQAKNFNSCRTVVQTQGPKHDITLLEMTQGYR